MTGREGFLVSEMVKSVKGVGWMVEPGVCCGCLQSRDHL